MQSANYELRKAYTAMFNQHILSAPSFYMFAPQTFMENYIVFSIPNQRDVGTLNQTNMQTVQVQIKICTCSNKTNSGNIVDTIANQIYQLFYYSRTNIIELQFPFQVTSTLLVSDIISNYQVDGNLVFIDRIITFEHKIYSF